MVTWVDLLNAVWITGVLSLIAAVIFAFCWMILWLYSLLLSGQRYRVLLLRTTIAGFPLGLSGLVSGYLTGISRVPAVTALVPAILTFIGLILVYLVGRSGHLRMSVTGFCIVVFTISLLLGTSLGSISRERKEDADIRTSVEHLKMKTDSEFLVRRYRKGLGLPPEMPEFSAKSGAKDASDKKE
jgi:hypothetical protein